MAIKEREVDIVVWFLLFVINIWSHSIDVNNILIDFFISLQLFPRIYHF